MTKPFELGGLQMILSEPQMSNSSGGTHMDHAIKPKFRVWQKLVKNAHFPSYCQIKMKVLPVGSA